MTSLLFALGLALGSPSLLLAQESPDQARPGLLVRWHDVRALSSAHLRDRGVDVRLHLASSHLDRLEPDDWDVPVEEHSSLDDYGWAQVVIDALGEDWPDDQVFVDQRGGFLRVEGTTETQEEVIRVLSELSAHFLATVELELFVLAHEPATVGAVLNRAEADALLAEAELLDYASKTTMLGVHTRLGSEGRRAALVDYDVEVAQHARTADPMVTVLREGTDLGVLLVSDETGGFFARLWGRRGRHLETRRVALGGLGEAPIELPVMSTTVGVASGSIEDGGALVLGQDWNADGFWLVRARRSTGGDGAAARAPFVSLGALTAVPLLVAIPAPASTSPSGGNPGTAEGFDQQLGSTFTDPSFAESDVLDELWNERDELGLGGSMLLLGDELYVRGSEALLAHARRKVRALQADLAGPTVVLDLRLGLVGRAEALDLARGADRSAFLERAQHRVLGAVRLGDSLLVVGGNERSYLKDHDVEIAQAAAIDDPIVEGVFDGISFWCVPSRVAAGKLSLLVDLTVHAHPEEARTIPALTWAPRDPSDSSEDNVPVETFDHDATIELPATARATTRTNLVVEENEWKLVACVPFGGDERTLVGFLRARTKR